jgi:hypothetical protein
MIRRGFWLTVGAVGGIMAYRRVARVTKKGWARETLSFTRDVRDGMDLYIARHPGGSGPTLGATADENEKNEKDDR